jgi:WhiB family redox-sensing transcriptional regulator
MSTLPSEEWVTRANCRAYPAEFFFPAGRIGVIEAKRVCGDCRVQEKCLDYALTNRIDHGVWGGQSERARQQIRRARRSQRPAGTPLQAGCDPLGPEREEGPLVGT